jgi:hypothetical protein
MRRLKELLWHLADAASAVVEGPLHDEVRQMRVMLEELTWRDADELEHLDVIQLRDRVMEILRRASKARREQIADPSDLELATADLSGVDLAGTNLRGADLRYARLSSAVLTDADLFAADLFGAEMRDTDVRGARLAGTLFLTPMQLEVTIGDKTTTIPPGLRRPDPWSAGGGE